MPRTLLHNYLRTYRRRAGLSQRDVAALLGSAGATCVSRHESAERVPALRMLIVYEIVYDAPLRELYAGEAERAKTLLRTRISRTAPPRGGMAAQKVAFLSSLANRIRAEA